MIKLDDFLGFERAVIVETGSDDVNHATMKDALARYPDRFRGVALVEHDASTTEVQELNEAGVRGCRVNFMPHLPTAIGWPDIHRLAELVVPFGWHIQLHFQGLAIVEHKESIKEIQAPVVIDHMGRIDLHDGPDSDSERALFELLDSGSVWVKTSGSDRISLQGPPYDDAVDLASRLVRYAPDRVLWGTDWPHVNIFGYPPDDGLLANIVGRIAPSNDVLRRLLVTNPEEIYGF